MFFLDSGAHSLFTKHAIAKGTAGAGHRRAASSAEDVDPYYDSDEFWEYVDDYARFVKEHADVIDLYANVDVIFDPKRSWRVLKYLEKEHKLNPVPVVHYNCPLKWVQRHLDHGYEYLGIGGMGQEVSAVAWLAWADEVFDLICPPPKRLPVAKCHGFAMTSYPLMRRYPWWSVDSATWTKLGAYGNIMVPRTQGGKFTFDKEPYVVTVSKDAPSAPAGLTGTKFASATAALQSTVRRWLEEIGLKEGRWDGDEVAEAGVCTGHTERKVANLIYFERFRASLPEYPWAWVPPADLGHGLGLRQMGF